MIEGQSLSRFATAPFAQGSLFIGADCADAPSAGGSLSPKPSVQPQKMLKILLDSRKNLCYNIRNTVEVHCVKSTADAKGLTARCQQERGKCRRKTGVASVLVWMNKIIPTVAFAESYLNSTGISVCLQSRPVCRLFCFCGKCKNAPDFGKNILCSRKREQHEKNNF